MTKFKEYLGDGVYCDFDGYHLVLTTEDGLTVSNTIYLDESVVLSLVKYLGNLKAQTGSNESAEPKKKEV